MVGRAGEESNARVRRSVVHRGSVERGLGRVAADRRLADDVVAGREQAHHWELRAQEWARVAVPFLLQIDAKDNGQPLTAPG